MSRWWCTFQLHAVRFQIVLAAASIVSARPLYYSMGVPGRGIPPLVAIAMPFHILTCCVLVGQQDLECVGGRVEWEEGGVREHVERRKGRQWRGWSRMGRKNKGRKNLNRLELNARL